MKRGLLEEWFGFIQSENRPVKTNAVGVTKTISFKIYLVNRIF